jgi:hypothetical protein
MVVSSTKKETSMADDPDYLAIVYIMAGSCYARSKTREEALRRVKAEAKAFARPFGGFKKGAVLKVNLFDLSNTGIQEVTWDDMGIHADGNPMPIEAEVVTLTM